MILKYYVFVSTTISNHPELSALEVTTHLIYDDIQLHALINLK